MDSVSEGREVLVDEINPTAKQFGFIDFRLSLYESVDLGGLPYIDDENQQRERSLGISLLVARVFYSLMNMPKHTIRFKLSVGNYCTRVRLAIMSYLKGGKLFVRVTEQRIERGLINSLLMSLVVAQ